MDITSMQSPCVDISVPFPNPHCLDTTNIWLCQSNLTSYRWGEAVSGGGGSVSSSPQNEMGEKTESKMIQIQRTDRELN